MRPLDAEVVLRTLLEHDVEFVVIGGLAVAAHGYVRATQDVALVPRPDPQNRRRLYDALLELDARPLELGDLRPEELPVPFSPDGLDEGGNWALDTAAGRVDVMQWVEPRESWEALCAHAKRVVAPEVGPVLFAGFEHLVAMKRRANRLEDRVDLERLSEARGETTP